MLTKRQVPLLVKFLVLSGKWSFFKVEFTYLRS